MKGHKLIKKFSNSQLDHEVHIPNLRSTLYVKSSNIFQALHENSNTDTLSVVAEEYTKTLKEQIQLVEQYYGPEAVKERDTYQHLERLWTLCQVLYFLETSNKYDITPLMDWYNKSYKPYLLEFDKQSIYYCKSTFEHVHFWSYATRLVLFGQLDQLSNLFSRALDNAQNQNYWSSFSSLGKVLELVSQGIDHLKSQHDTLQSVFTDLCQHSTSNHTNKLIDILGLLMGDERVTLQYAKDDINAFISSNFYKINSNNHKNKTIHESAKEFFTTHSNNRDLGRSHQCMRLFIAGAISDGLEITSHDDWWFIAHLADLFNIKKMLDRSVYYTIDDASTLSMDAREYFILTYASYLINQFGLWKESFIYLMTCGEIGKEVVIEHLTTMDFQNDDSKLHQVVKFCIDYSMKNYGLVLYEKKASDCLELKEYKKALQYYSQAEKYQYLDQVFSAVLEDFIHTGQLHDIQSFSDTSNFKGIHYIIYRDISKINSLFLQRQFQSAANTFKSLLRYDGIPKLIIPIIFAEGWKVLNRKANFTLNDLLEMKKVWVKLKDSCTPQDFIWYHYYINSKSIDDNNSVKDDEILENILLCDMIDFFDTTAVIIARAIDGSDKN